MGQLATIHQAQNYLCVSNRPQFTQIFSGDEGKATRFLALALGVLQQNPKLLACEERTIRDSLLQAAECDLVPGSAMQHCFLVPYKRTCQLQIGYRGLAEMVQREGAVKKVWGNIVYQDEVDEGKFVVHSGGQHELIHNRDPFREDPPSWSKLLEEGLCGAYACAELATGAVNFEVVGLDVLERAKAMSRSDAWDQWATEMVKKFPLKRLCKRLPKTNHMEGYWKVEQQLGTQDAIQLAPKGDAYELADDALGDTTVDIPQRPYMPKPECPRSGVSWEIERAWKLLSEEQIAELDMEGELADYLSPEATSDAQARHLLGKMLELLS